MRERQKNTQEDHVPKMFVDFILFQRCLEQWLVNTDRLVNTTSKCIG